MYKFSEPSINFIKIHYINNNLFSLPIDYNSLEEIIDDIVLNYETGMLTDEEKPIEGFEKLQTIGTQVVDEYSLHADEEIDFEFLNNKLSR